MYLANLITIRIFWIQICLIFIYFFFIYIFIEHFFVDTKSIKNANMVMVLDSRRRMSHFPSKEGVLSIVTKHFVRRQST